MFFRAVLIFDLSLGILYLYSRAVRMHMNKKMKMNLILEV